MPLRGSLAVASAPAIAHLTECVKSAILSQAEAVERERAAGREVCRERARWMVVPVPDTSPDTWSDEERSLAVKPVSNHNRLALHKAESGATFVAVAGPAAEAVAHWAGRVGDNRLTREWKSRAIIVFAGADARTSAEACTPIRDWAIAALASPIIADGCGVHVEFVFASQAEIEGSDLSSPSPASRRVPLLVSGDNRLQFARLLEVMFMDGIVVKNVDVQRAGRLMELGMAGSHAWCAPCSCPLPRGGPNSRQRAGRNRDPANLAWCGNLPTDSSPSASVSCTLAYRLSITSPRFHVGPVAADGMCPVCCKFGRVATYAAVLQHVRNHHPASRVSREWLRLAGATTCSTCNQAFLRLAQHTARGCPATLQGTRGFRRGVSSTAPGQQPTSASSSLAELTRTAGDTSEVLGLAAEASHQRTIVANMRECATLNDQQRRMPPVAPPTPESIPRQALHLVLLALTHILGVMQAPIAPDHPFPPPLPPDPPPAPRDEEEPGGTPAAAGVSSRTATRCPSEGGVRGGGPVATSGRVTAAPRTAGAAPALTGGPSVAPPPHPSSSGRPSLQSRVRAAFAEGVVIPADAIVSLWRHIVLSLPRANGSATACQSRPLEADALDRLLRLDGATHGAAPQSAPQGQGCLPGPSCLTSIARGDATWVGLASLGGTLHAVRTGPATILARTARVGSVAASTSPVVDYVALEAAGAANVNAASHTDAEEADRGALHDLLTRDPAHVGVMHGGSSTIRLRSASDSPASAFVSSVAPLAAAASWLVDSRIDFNAPPPGTPPTWRAAANPARWLSFCLAAIGGDLQVNGIPITRTRPRASRAAAAVTPTARPEVALPLASAPAPSPPPSTIPLSPGLGEQRPAASPAIAPVRQRAAAGAVAAEPRRDANGSASRPQRGDARHGPADDAHIAVTQGDRTRAGLLLGWVCSLLFHGADTRRRGGKCGKRQWFAAVKGRAALLAAGEYTEAFRLFHAAQEDIAEARQRRCASTRARSAAEAALGRSEALARERSAQAEKAIRLAKVGRLAQAASGLMTSGTMPGTPQVVAAMKGFHPPPAAAASDGAGVPSSTAAAADPAVARRSPTPFVLSFGDFEKALRGSNPISAAGPHGDRFRYWMYATGGSNIDRRARQLMLARLFRCCALDAAGELPPLVDAMLNEGRLIALRKKPPVDSSPQGTQTADPEQCAAAQGGVAPDAAGAPGAPPIRPIAICDCLSRLTGCSILRQVGGTLNRHFAGLQFGAGAPGGMERMQHAIRGHLSRKPDDCVLKLDFVNAFNSVNRNAFMREVARVLPALLPYFAARYGRPSPLHLRRPDGSYAQILSQRGVRQGDPCGPALFALALHPVLQKAHAEFAVLGVEIMAYLDDVTLCGPAARLCVAAQRIVDLAGLIGLKCHPGGRGKTQLMRGSVNSDLTGWNDWAPVCDLDDSLAAEERIGMDILGMPLGSADAMRTEQGVARVCESLLRKLVTLCDRLHDVAAASQACGIQVACLLLRYCGATRIGHLTRSLPPDESELLMQKGDGIIMGTLCSLLHFRLEDQLGVDFYNGNVGTLKEVICAPLRCGGLGLRQQRLHRHAAYMASLISAARRVAASRVRRAGPGLDAEASSALQLSAAYDFMGPGPRTALEAAYVRVRAATVSTVDGRCAASAELIKEGSTFNAEGLRPLNGLLLPQDLDGAKRLPQSDLSRTIDEACLARRLHSSDYCAATKACWLSASGRSAGCWADGAPFSPDVQIRNDLYKIAASIRIGLGRLPDTDGFPATAAVGARGVHAAVDLSGRSALYFARGGMTIRRHDGVVRALERAIACTGLRVYHESEGGLVLASSATLAALRRAASNGHVRYDFVVEAGMSSLPLTGVDVVVTSPCTVSIRARAALTSGAAAEAAARAKWASWRASVAADQIRFFPLAAETHGTLGAEFWQFLYALATHAAATDRCSRADFLARTVRQVQTALAVGSAECVLNYLATARGPASSRFASMQGAASNGLDADLDGDFHLAQSSRSACAASA